MSKSTITIDVHLDDAKVPEKIMWASANEPTEERQKAKAVMLSLWDGAEKTALRIDLWTKEMMVDEMTDFFYQTMMTMADSYDRATHDAELVNDMKTFAKLFYQKFRKKQEQTNKLS